MVAGYSSLCRVESCGVSLFTEGTLDVCSGAGTGLLLKGFRAEHQWLQRWDRRTHLTEVGADLDSR